MFHTINSKLDRKDWRIDEDGNLRVTARILKEGVYPYTAKEIPGALLMDLMAQAPAKDVYCQYIPAEAFDKAALESAEGKSVIVNAHEWQTPDKAEEIDSLDVGSVAGKAKNEENSIVVDFIIKNADIIQRIQNGELVEVSAGYNSKTDARKGEWNGKSYDAEQSEIRINHVLLLPEGKGRCGYDVRILNENTKEIPMFVRIKNSKGVETSIEVNPANAKEASALDEIVRIANENEQELESCKTTHANEIIALKDGEEKEKKTNSQIIEDHKSKVTALEALVNELKANLADFADEEKQEKEVEKRQEYANAEEELVKEHIRPEDREKTKSELDNCWGAHVKNKNAAKEPVGKKIDFRKRSLVTRIMNEKKIDLTKATDGEIDVAFKTLIASRTKTKNTLPPAGEAKSSKIHPSMKR